MGYPLRTLTKGWAVVVMLGLWLMQPSCGRPSPYAMRAMVPTKLLKEVGRTICDARTVEIEEMIDVTPESANSFQDGSSTVVFGPNGEYRLESRHGVIVHNGRHVAFFRAQSGKEGNPSADTSVANPRHYQPRQGPHWRYPGDLVMAAGMGRACDPITPYLRLFGSRWLKQLSIIDRILEDSVERCGDHDCRKITMEWNYGGRITFWVDLSRTTLHKIILNEKTGCSMSVVFEETRINPRLTGKEFVIPRDVIERAPTE